MNVEHRVVRRRLHDARLHDAMPGAKRGACQNEPLRHLALSD